jgi:hypothetical protein
LPFELKLLLETVSLLAGYGAYSPEHGVLLCNLALEFTNQVVEVVGPFVHLGVVLPQPFQLLEPFLVDLLDGSVLILHGPHEFLILSQGEFLGLLDDFGLLLEGFIQVLASLHLLFPILVLQISDLLFECQLIIHQNVVQLLVFEAQLLK